MPSPTVKTCKRCGESKPPAQFGKVSQNRDGMDHCCKTCRRSISDAWKRENLEVVDWHRAKDSLVRQHGPDGATPQRIAAMLEARHLARMERARRKAERTPPLVRVIPPKSITRHELMDRCGIAHPALHYHMKRNTAGIRDAHFKHPQPGKAAAALYDAERAEPFIALMQSKPRFWRRVLDGGHGS